MQGRRKKSRRRPAANLSGSPGLRPYFSRNNQAGEPVVELYHGECLAVLEQLPPAIAAAAITDPPYCSGGMTTAARTQDPVKKYCQNNNSRGRPTFAGDTRDQRSFAFWATLWMSQLQRIVSEAGYVLVFADWRQTPTMTDVVQAGGFTWRGTVAWNKGRGARAPHKGYFRHQCEYVVWGSNGACKPRHAGGPFDGAIDVKVRKADKHHITGKPTELMQQLVDVVAPGELVVDPFAGSGTTGVACLLTGRRAILIEQSEEYCEIAARRLEAAAAGDVLKAA